MKLILLPNGRAKYGNCRLHGEHCKTQPLPILLKSHAGLPPRREK